MVTPRFYYLPSTSACLEGCGLCKWLSCTNQVHRDLDSLRYVLKKARKAEFGAVLFPSGLLLRPDKEAVVELCRENQLGAILQIDAALLPASIEGVTSLVKMGVSLNIVLATQDLPREDLLRALESLAPQTYYTLIPHRGFPVLSILAALPLHRLERLHFHVPPLVDGDPLGLTIREAHRLLEQIRRQYPTIHIRPPLGHEVWDPRIAPDLGLEPDVAPSFSYRIADSDVQVSVVIPSFNSGPLLKNVVRHLLLQDLPRRNFEIILVDDGSSDNTEELIRNFVAPEASQMNLTYLKFPRPRERRMGDGNFRAGIARNLGVKSARGEFLCFLDADIIVAKDHLRNLIERHQRWDVIQSVRLHLKSEEGNEFVSYDSVGPATETYVLEERYWGPFFKSKSWPAIPFYWKYTCTYALSLRTKLFKEVGWFRRTFVYYGFEDTDLGYRLAKKNYSFYLNPQVTYHLSQGKGRSEYKNSSFTRHLLLSKTAKVFYLNNLDPDIYEHFKSFMHGEWSLQLWLKRTTQRSNTTKQRQLES